MGSGPIGTRLGKGAVRSFHGPPIGRGAVAAPGIAAFLGVIDLVGVSAEAAYSVSRKLRAGYNGAAFRVRRSSDNSEKDIAFNSACELDTVDLLAFCGAGNGFVVTLYDHSENARNLTQATASRQPQIVGAGAVLTRGGKPTMVFDGGDWINANLSFTTLTANAVFKASALSGITNIVRHQPGSGTEWALRVNPNYHYYRIGTVPPGFGNPGTVNAHVFTGLQNDGGSLRAFADGTQLYTASAPGTASTSGWFTLGAQATDTIGTELFNGDISEAIAFASVLTTTQRQTLERNQGAFFGIAVA